MHCFWLILGKNAKISEFFPSVVKTMVLTSLEAFFVILASIIRGVLR